MYDLPGGPGGPGAPITYIKDKLLVSVTLDTFRMTHNFSDDSIDHAIALLK